MCGFDASFAIRWSHLSLPLAVTSTSLMWQLLWQLFTRISSFCGNAVCLVRGHLRILKAYRLIVTIGLLFHCRSWWWNHLKAIRWFHPRFLKKAGFLVGCLHVLEQGATQQKTQWKWMVFSRFLSCWGKFNSSKWSKTTLIKDQKVFSCGYVTFFWVAPPWPWRLPAATYQLLFNKHILWLKAKGGLDELLSNRLRFHCDVCTFVLLRLRFLEQTAQ